MAALKRTLTLLMILALTAFGAAIAQDDQQQNQEEQTQTRTIEIEGEEVAPLGEIQVGEAQEYDGETATIEVEVETGAIIFTADTPTDQSPNIDLIGPNGYYERFEVNADGEQVVDGLLPGVYSVAATDEGLQVAHTLVEVTAGQAMSVAIVLQELAAYQEGAFEPDARTAFPDNAFEADEPQAIEDAEFGEVTVETENDDALFVVTGPNGYSREFTGGFTANDLSPGVYVIAGTMEGSWAVEGAISGVQIATSAVEVSVSQAVTFVPVYDIVGAEVEEVEAETEEVEDVAGGGEAEVETEEVETEEVETDEAETEEVETDVETEEDVETDEADDVDTEESTEETGDEEEQGEDEQQY